MTDTRMPDSLRPGEVVGPWLIEGYAGRGSYGVVYRARRAEPPGSLPVALKIAVFPHDARFEREAELLSRTHHPAIPELLDRGSWHASPKVTHPYLVMEWIQGKPLYEWARVHNPTSRQVLLVVAQIAWGLEAVHGSNSLHRDVKGDNTLVEPEGRAVLTDFGSGTWKGAPPLTERVMPPNTPEYRSPEALRFEWGNFDKKGARYPSGPADDLYSLGVALYRLLTRVYPPPGTDPEVLKAQGLELSPRRVPVLELNGRVVAALAALTERLLSKDPLLRGTAREAAEAAEAAAEHLGPEADVPIFDTGASGAVANQVPPAASVEPVSVEAAAVRVPEEAGPEASSGVPRRRLFVTLLLLAVGGTWWVQHTPREAVMEGAQAGEPDADAAPDPEATGLGDGGVPVRVTSQEEPIPAAALSMPVPSKPLDGQRRPPCKRSGEVVINGGCWVHLTNIEPPCGDDAYEWQDSCYHPVLDRRRIPTTQQPR